VERLQEVQTVIILESGRMEERKENRNVGLKKRSTWLNLLYFNGSGYGIMITK
jgi:hypothetical protein